MALSSERAKPWSRRKLPNPVVQAAGPRYGAVDGVEIAACFDERRGEAAPRENAAGLAIDGTGFAGAAGERREEAGRVEGSIGPNREPMQGLGGPHGVRGPLRIGRHHRFEGSSARHPSRRQHRTAPCQGDAGRQGRVGLVEGREGPVGDGVPISLRVLEPALENHGLPVGKHRHDVLLRSRAEHGLREQLALDGELDCRNVLATRRHDRCKERHRDAHGQNRSGRPGKPHLHVSRLSVHFHPTSLRSQLTAVHSVDS